MRFFINPFILLNFLGVKIGVEVLKTVQSQTILVKNYQNCVQFNELMLLHFMKHNQKFIKNWKTKSKLTKKLNKKIPQKSYQATTAWTYMTICYKIIFMLFSKKAWLTYENWQIVLSSGNTRLHALELKG